MIDSFDPRVWSGMFPGVFVYGDCVLESSDALSMMCLELPWVIDIGCLSEIGAVIFWIVTSWSTNVLT